MDVIELGCSILRTALLERLMGLFGYFGHGSVASIITLLLVAHGHINNNQRTKRAGITFFATVLLTGIATELLRHVISVPRPVRPSSPGFPSGQTSVAFASASVLTATFPAFGPLFYLLAMLTALSRLYFRAHFTSDVVGSAIIGLLVAMPIINKFITRPHAPEPGLTRFGIWTGVAVLGISGLAFFYAMESRIDAYRVDLQSTQNGPAIVSVDFGTAETRSYLRYGWFGDEQWLGGKQTVVWSNGLASELTINLPKVLNSRFRLRLFPYAPKGAACQTVEVRINDTNVHKIFLEKGWHSYEFIVPQTAVKIGANSVQFFYDHSESPRARENTTDARSLGVAFDKLEVF